VGWYSDGQGHCFACDKHYFNSSEEITVVDNSRNKDLITDYEIAPLSKRSLSSDTCEKFRYGIGDYKGKKVQIANYANDKGSIVAQKIRFANKDFVFLGTPKEALLFGQNIWKGQAGGKRIVITEGEIDCLSVSQVQGNKWPVVSVPTGAQGAAKALAKNLEWLESFDEVVLLFDNDEAGQKAIEDCVDLFSIGKCKIAKLPLKDANEMLVAGRGDEIVKAIWNAEIYRPDGIITIDDISEDLLAPVERGMPWPWATLTEATYGIRKGEVYALGAGTGIGKTDVFTQIISHTIKEQHQDVGVFYLEQPPHETIKRIAGKVSGKRYHVPDEDWTKEELEHTLEQMRHEMGKVYLYNHFGSSDWDIIKSRIRYLHTYYGVDYIFLDHLTALASHADDERRALEELMAELSGIAQELQIAILFVSHLATPEGRPHEEGGRVTIRHFKGSRAIGFWSHFMFGLERNQQAEDESERQTTTFRILKDRYTGQATGKTFELNYDQKTGLLYEQGMFNAIDNDEEF
jgi:twinkle protein